MKPVNETSISKQEQAKKTWHRPRLTFVTLTATAFNTGSPIDGGSSGTSTD